LQKLKTFLTSLRNIVQKAITTHFEGFFELYKIGLLIFPKPEVKWPKPEVEKHCDFSASGFGHLTSGFKTDSVLKQQRHESWLFVSANPSRTLEQILNKVYGSKEKS